MQNKVLIPPSKSLLRSFTLIELIVVIIIVGILASLGISQYSKMVEKGRTAELRMIVGQIRKLAYEYKLANGTYTGMTLDDVNIGTGSDQIPSVCRSTHYFSYYATGNDSTAAFFGVRCSSGGKTPNHSVPYYAYGIQWDGTLEYWTCNTSGGWGGATGPCP